MKPLKLVAIIALIALVAATASLLLTPSAPRSPLINGAGASFPAPQLREWARRFNEETGIRVEYNSVGSGAGRAMFFNRTVLFAFSDPPLERDLYFKHKGGVLQLPLVVGAVVITYNVPEIPKGIKFNITGEVLASIYKGEISKWDDDRIKRANPAIANLLPNKEIIVVHRSDSSGTTRVFTGYLRKAAPNVWGPELVGFVVDWPVDRTGRGLGGKGNEGVTQLVMSSPYSIGYVEANYALSLNMPIAWLMNREGFYTSPTQDAVLSALENAVGLLPDTPLGDFSEALDAVLDAPGPSSYPIASFSYMLLYTKYDASTSKALAEFIKFTITKGQRHLLPGYYPLPSKLVELGFKAAEIIEKGVS